MTVKSRIVGILVPLGWVLVTSGTYAVGLGELLPDGHPFPPQIPEYALLALLGVTMLVVARQARQARRQALTLRLIDVHAAIRRAPRLTAPASCARREVSLSR